MIESSFYTIVEENDTGGGKNDKENVVTFKMVFVFGLVVIGVKVPHKPVHDIFMGEPCDTFHKKENT